jgi:hypothetical protein
MPGNKSADARVQSARTASLCIAWAVIAGAAYLGLIKRAIDLATAATPWPGVGVDPGLIAIKPSQLTADYRTYATIALVAIPILVGAVIALGVATRVRPRAAPLPAGLLVAALLGLLAAGVIFLATVATASNGVEFVVALATIVLIAVLLRLQKVVRRFYQRAPAAASLVLAALTLAYLILSNGTNVSSIVLSQIDVWLALVSFAIILNSGVKLVRLANKA